MVGPDGGTASLSAAFPLCGTRQPDVSVDSGVNRFESPTVVDRRKATTIPKEIVSRDPLHITAPTGPTAKQLCVQVGPSLTARTAHLPVRTAGLTAPPYSERMLIAIRNGDGRTSRSLPAQQRPRRRTGIVALSDGSSCCPLMITGSSRALMSALPAQPLTIVRTVELRSASHCFDLHHGITNAHAWQLLLPLPVRACTHPLRHTLVYSPMLLPHVTPPRPQLHRASMQGRSNAL